MIVECGQCRTKFKVSDDKITPAGVKVRCSKCKHIFTVVRSTTETPAQASSARIPNVEQPLSQPFGGGRGVGSQMESKPIKKDSSWPPSARPHNFPLSEIPDKIDQRMVDQIDLDSDAPLSLFNRDLPAAAPAPNARDDLFGTLPSPQAVPGDILAPEISVGKLLIDQFSAEKKTAEAPDATAPYNLFGNSVAASDSPQAADLFANVDIDVQLGPKPPPEVGAGAPSAETSGGELFRDVEFDPGNFLSTNLAEPGARVTKEPIKSVRYPLTEPPSAFGTVPPRSLEPPPLPTQPDGFSVNEINAAPQAASQKEDRGVFIGNDPFADLEGYQSAPVEGGSELTLDRDGKMLGSKAQTSPAPSHRVDRVSSPTSKSPVVATSAPLPSMDRSPRAPEESPHLLRLYKIGFGVLVFVGLLLVFIVYRSGGKPDLTNWSTYVGAFSSSATRGQANSDVQVKKIATTTYRNFNGHALLLLWGEVYNASRESLARVMVTGQLRSDKGQLLGEYAVPAGVVFTPGEIYQMGDAQVVAAEYQKKLQGLEGKELSPGGSLPFMIVTYDHPDITGAISVKIVPSTATD